MKMKERTLVIIKPDAVKRNVIGNIISRLESRCGKVVALKMVKLRKEQAMKLYECHKRKRFYESLCEWMCSGPVVLMVLEGENVIENTRRLIGDTNPEKAKIETIRAQYGTSTRRNAVHASADKLEAEAEIALFFSKSELMEGER